MDRAEEVFEKYAKAHCLSKKDVERDYKNYDMSQRLRLADMVAADGHKTVADLGSQKGGMSHALKEVGVKVVSTEIYVNKYPFENFLFCDIGGFRDNPLYVEQFKDLRKVNEDAVCCDSFRPPFRGLDALVSYMFLGLYLPDKLVRKGVWFFRKPRTINDAFNELSKSADTIYSVELQSEYSDWFGSKKSMEPSEIKEHLKDSLPDFDVECLGAFGTYTAGTSPDERLGFKFSRKAPLLSAAPTTTKGSTYGRILSGLFGKKL